jgi:hypothetical protein
MNLWQTVRICDRVRAHKKEREGSTSQRERERERREMIKKWSQSFHKRVWILRYSLVCTNHSLLHAYACFQNRGCHNHSLGCIQDIINDRCLVYSKLCMHFFLACIYTRTCYAFQILMSIIVHGICMYVRIHITGGLTCLYFNANAHKK